MAGVALIVAKNDNVSGLNKIESKLDNYLKNSFGKYFPFISLDRIHPKHLLIQFRKKKEDSDFKTFRDDKGNWLYYSGHVFFLNETKVLSAKELWELYLTNNENLPNFLDGHFVIKLFNKSENKLIVFNDFFKNRTEYYTSNDNYLMFTPFTLLTAAIQKTELDLQALNEFLWRYYIQSQRSILKNVQRMDLAEWFEIKDSKIKIKHYWKWPESYTSITFEQAAEQLSESMKESARLINLLSKKPVVDLTMGQDSRQVVVGFTNQNIPFISSIYGKKDFYEVVQMKERTKRLGIENIHIELEEDYLSNPREHFKKGVFLSSCDEPGYLIGRIMYMRSRYLPYSDFTVNGVHGRYYKDGLWNEMYIFNLYREPKKIDTNLLLKYRILNKNYDDSIFISEYQNIKKKSWDYFRNMITDSISGYENSPVSIQVDKFDTMHYGTFGNIANTSCDYVINLISPLMLRRNVELGIELPVKWKWNLSKIQRAVVSRLDPKMAMEKTDYANINMIPKNGLNYIPFITTYWLAQSKKYRDKIKNLIGFSSKTQLQKAWDYLPVYKTIFNNEEVKDHLNYDKMILSSILEKENWEQFKERFEPDGMSYDKISDYEFLFKILSVEYFLREAQSLRDFIKN